MRLAGIAGAVAGAISMAAGEWVSISAQNDLIRRELDVERRELERHPLAETIELAGMYEAHGMAPEQARLAAADVMRRPDEALIVHAREELGVDPEGLARRGRRRALSLVCFLLGALAPVVPWLGSATGTAPTMASIAIGIVVAADRRGVDRRLRRAPDDPIDRPPGADRARRLRDHLRRSASSSASR